MFFLNLFSFFYNNTYFAAISFLLTSRYIRNSFLSFLIGRYSSRLFYFFFHINSQIHVYFFFWFLCRYKELYLHLSMRKCKEDLYLYYLLSCCTSHSLPITLVIQLYSLFTKKERFSLSYSALLKQCFFLSSIFISVSKRCFVSELISLSFVHFIYNCASFKWHFLFARYCLINLVQQIEYSFFSLSQVPHFFFINFYEHTSFLGSDKYHRFLLKRSGAVYFNHAVPPITSAKIICDYIVVMLSIGRKLSTIFYSILEWQRYWQVILDSNVFSFINKYGLNIGDFIYPLKGIRILCSGPTYKARRTSSLKYHLWVSDEFLTGRMPLSTVNLCIDYFQAFSVVRRSNIGIKVWLLMEDVL